MTGSPYHFPKRSALYIPGSNARALEKAQQLNADSLILDLEDAVAPEMKEEARERVCQMVRANVFQAPQVLIRINGLDTGWGRLDLEAALAAKPRGLVLPKVNAAADVLLVQHLIGELSGKNEITLWAMIETPMGVLNVRDIAALSNLPENRLAGLIMGVNDLAKDTGASLENGRFAVLPGLSFCALTAKAYGLAILDGVYNNFKDMSGFEKECHQGRMLGMDGKTLIHPDQIEGCHKVFSPSEIEIAEAREIIETFALPENQGKGAVSFKGRMIERLHLDMARGTLAYHAAAKESEN